MAFETDEEREIRHRAELAAEAVAHKNHLENPSLVAPPWFKNSVAGTSFTPPEIPASPTPQNIADVLVALGFATQAES